MADSLPDSLPDSLTWVYAVVPAERDAGGAPAGLEGAAVRLVRAGVLGALVSSLDARAYAPEMVEVRVADVSWLGPRAAAHDAVVVWASDRGPMIPLPMFTVFRDDAGVAGMLRERADALRALLERAGRGREYVVRVFRLDDVLEPALGAVSPRIAELERQAAGGSPGQRYLLQRKLETARKSEARRIATETARETYDALGAHSLEAAADELPRNADATRGAAVLNAAFLVAPERYADFQAALTDLARRHEPHGFRFEFTGPWPPFHFTRGAAGA